MKVIHIHFGKDGGSERFFVNLVNGLASKGVEQWAFIRPNRVWKKDIENAAHINEGTFNRISLYRFWLAAKLKRKIGNFQPDAIMAWAPRASRFLPSYQGCIKISRLGDFPLRLEYFTNTDTIVCNTPDIAQRVRELGWQKPVEVISNFTRAHAAAPVARSTLQTPDDAFLIVGAGRFVRRKGFHTLLDAAARLPRAWVWIVGDGEERQALEQQAVALGIADRVRFAGWQADTSPFVAAADAFVVPSLHEPLGNVILEAWSIGRPVVSSRAEGPRWMMTDGEDGLMFDVEDADGLAQALARLEADPALRASLVAGGTQTLAARFSLDAITDAYIELFRSQSPR
ncbi:glycosyltransferase [Flaviflagellibacter deserti]|uniref:Glycosyltransferase n=1 Tax=Flaviflagellibacter deserti TaxID=2267266 RepID=A0ABV9Z6Z4_9HYPH